MKKLLKIWIWCLVDYILCLVALACTALLLWWWIGFSAVTHHWVTGWLWAWIVCFIVTLLAAVVSEKLSDPLMKKWHIVFDGYGHAKIAENS